MAFDNETSSLAVSAAKASKNLMNTAFETAKSGKNIVGTAVEAAKDFFHELVSPNMTIEKIAEVAAPRLDEVIEENEEKGLKYSAGKFKVGYVDEEHFSMAFEMYFKDAEGKWYKSAGTSDPREAELLDFGSWKTLQTLKAVEFPITAPTKEDDAAEVEESIEAEVSESAAPTVGESKK